MNSLRVVVAVSTDRSDLYFANQLIRRVNVVGVLVENQLPRPDQRPLLLKIASLAAKPSEMFKRSWDSITRRWNTRFAIYNKVWHLTDFGEQGLELFAPSPCEVSFADFDTPINSSRPIQWLRKLHPDVVAVCGTSLLNPDFLAIPRKGVLNLHGGLSQRYRGLNTTDWAIHNGEPEYVGATVHYVSTGIDDGSVVYQGRPVIEADDTPNTLYVKVVKLGVDMMEAAIRDIEQGQVSSTPAPGLGTLYLARQFTNRARSLTWRNYARGVIADYVRDKATRDMVVDKIMINEFRRSRRIDATGL